MRAVGKELPIVKVGLITFLLLSMIGFETLAAPDTDSSFMSTWERTDKPVQDGQATRTWMWGPAAASLAFAEEYAEGTLTDGTSGKRLVQYFDKSRMELTDPEADPGFVWSVTNGLLATELITGRLQVGHNDFLERMPAEVPVAGDPDDPDGPTYATFTELTEKVVNRSGLIVNERVDRTGQVTEDPTLNDRQILVGYHDPITEHNIAMPFWDFMNSSGVVYENGAFVEDRLFQDPVFATGRPITEPYWANVLVGGESKLVLMQCFERRCLTFTPDNAPEWQVEAGNVGLHYHTWRYQEFEDQRLTFVTDESGNDEIYTVQSNGLRLKNISSNPAQDNDFAWSPDGMEIAFASDRDGDFEIYVMDFEGAILRQLTENVGVDDRAPVWSPDGSQIAFTTNRDGDKEIYIMSADGSDPTNFSLYPGDDEFEPRWSPDGARIAYRSGRTDIAGRFATILIADVSNPSQPNFVSCGFEQRYEAHWSPYGDVLTYFANRYQSGALTFCVVDFEGETISEWVHNTGEYWPVSNETTAYTPDGRLLVYRCSQTADFSRCMQPDPQTGWYFFDPVNGDLESESENDPAALYPGVGWLSWSSDGSILAVQGTVCGSYGTVCVHSLSSQTTLPVTTMPLSYYQDQPVQWQPISSP